MWIKICGIKEVETARQVARAGASAIGLNFFEKSKRAVNLDQASEIAAAVRGELDLVGLFVNHSRDDVFEIAREVELDWIQLHGDESVEFLRELQSELPNVRLMKAFRIGADGFAGMARFLEECVTSNVTLSACLIDAAVAGEYGGTGHVAPWQLICEEYDRKNWPPLVLAGGITPDNVREAIETVKPWGVDTASGVESAPGVKDHQLIVEFVAAATN